MSNIIQKTEKRLTTIVESIKVSGKRVAATLGLSGLLGWWVLRLLADHAADIWVGRLAAAILGALDVIAGQALGGSLLLTLGVCVLVVIWAAWDSRARPTKPETPVVLPLSADEKDAVSRIRTLWYHRGGQVASMVLLRLLQDAEEQLRSRYYAKYFTVAVSNFEGAAQELEGVLNIEKKIPLDGVIAAFNGLFAAYLRTCELLYDMHQSDDLSLFAPRRLETFWEFRQAHVAFSADLVQATEYPGINKRLFVFHNRVAGHVSSRKFLGEQPWDGEPPLEPAAE